MEEWYKVYIGWLNQNKFTDTEDLSAGFKAAWIIRQFVADEMVEQQNSLAIKCLHLTQTQHRHRLEKKLLRETVALLESKAVPKRVKRRRKIEED